MLRAAVGTEIAESKNTTVRHHWVGEDGVRIEIRESPFAYILLRSRGVEWIHQAVIGKWI